MLRMLACALQHQRSARKCAHRATKWRCRNTTRYVPYLLQALQDSLGIDAIQNNRCVVQQVYDMVVT